MRIAASHSRAWRLFARTAARSRHPKCGRPSLSALAAIRRRSSAFSTAPNTVMSAVSRNLKRFNASLSRTTGMRRTVPSTDSDKYSSAANVLAAEKKKEDRRLRGLADEELQQRQKSQAQLVHDREVKAKFMTAAQEVVLQTRMNQQLKKYR